MIRPPQRIKLYLSILTSLMISFNSALTQDTPPKSPKGFANNFFLKAALALKLVKLVDTEPATPPDILEFKDIIYKTVKNDTLKLDMYRSNDINAPQPFLIFFHGGGWRSGKKEDYRVYNLDFAERGYITASISYRLSKTATYPAAVQDVFCAVRWLRAHAEDYFIDPDKIAVIGGSAGGHLSLLVGFAPDSVFAAPCEAGAGSRVQAVIDLYGPVDLTTEYGRTHDLTTSFFGVSYEKAPQRYVEASPLTWVSPDDPPTLIFHGTIDDLVPVCQSDTLVAALERAGIQNEYHRLKGWPHAMDLSQKVNDYCQYYMDRFLRRVFELD
jgi:acetyl esterase/lipase